jgi:hypothetical protein
VVKMLLGCTSKSDVTFWYEFLSPSFL